MSQQRKIKLTKRDDEIGLYVEIAPGKVKWITIAKGETAQLIGTAIAAVLVFLVVLAGIALVSAIAREQK